MKRFTKEFQGLKLLFPNLNQINLNFIKNNLRLSIKKIPGFPWIIIFFTVSMVIYLSIIVGINTSLTLDAIGINYINWSSILMFTLLFFFLYYYLYFFSLASNDNKTKFFLKKFNFWTVLSIYLILITILISNSLLVNLYPGVKEVNRDYSWKIHEEEFKGKINPIHISDITKSNAHHFVEGDILEITTSVKDNFLIKNIEFREESQKEKILNNKTESCGSKECSLRFTVSEKGYLYFFRINIYDKDNRSNVIFPAFLDLYPEVFSKNDYNDRNRNVFLLLSSLLSVIVLAVFAGVNQLRQIVQNK